MCPVRVHWHVKLNYKDYWRVKLTVTNFNYRLNYTQWTLVVQHPNLNNITEVFSFDYKPLVPYQSVSKSLISIRYSHSYGPLFDPSWSKQTLRGLSHDTFIFWPVVTSPLSLSLKMIMIWANILIMCLSKIHMQMTRECSTAWNSTMTYWWKQGQLGLFNQKCFSRRTRKLSPSSKDGHFPGKSTSMATNACFHHQTLIHTYPTLAIISLLPLQHCYFPCSSFLLYSFDLFSSLSVIENFEAKQPQAPGMLGSQIYKILSKGQIQCVIGMTHWIPQGHYRYWYVRTSFMSWNAHRMMYIA